MAELLTRRAALSAYLDASAARAFQPGKHDCALFVADWLVRLGLEDPAKAYRGTYDSAFGMACAIARFGGLKSLAEQTLHAIGLEPTGLPALGDVGVVMGEDEAGELVLSGGICVEGRPTFRWATLHPRGLIVGPFADARAWRVP